MKPYVRIGVPRGLVAGTAAALALTWGLFAIDRGQGLGWPAAQSGVYLALLTLAVASRRTKILIVRTLQRWTINPLMRALLAIGVNPLGLAVLQTRGRTSGRPRRTPVGNGRSGTDFWIIAEHGMKANYVRNILADPRVCDCASDADTDGLPGSQRCSPTTTRWPASAASSDGTRFAHSTR
jgi:hypothetical protein